MKDTCPPYTNILIDEFQDTDPIQMEIFKKFIEYPKTESFTVVGDINQVFMLLEAQAKIISKN